MITESTMIAYVNLVLKYNGFRTKVVKCEYVGNPHQAAQFLTSTGKRIATPIVDFGGDYISLRSILKITNKHKNFSYLCNGQSSRNCKEMIFFGEAEGKCARLCKTAIVQK
jgi:hypothetical protein